MHSARRVLYNRASTAFTLLVLLACSQTQTNRPSSTPSPIARAGPLIAVDGFLVAMGDRDTIALRRVTHPEMRLTTATDANGGSALTLSGDEFMRVVARASGARWNQRLLAPEVHSDGNLAAVWS